MIKYSDLTTCRKIVHTGQTTVPIAQNIAKHYLKTGQTVQTILTTLITLMIVSQAALTVNRNHYNVIWIQLSKSPLMDVSTHISQTFRSLSDYFGLLNCYWILLPNDLIIIDVGWTECS